MNQIFYTILSQFHEGGRGSKSWANSSKFFVPIRGRRVGVNEFRTKSPNFSIFFWRRPLVLVVLCWFSRYLQARKLYQGTPKENSRFWRFLADRIFILTMLRKQTEKQFTDKLDFFNSHFWYSSLWFVSEMNKAIIFISFHCKIFLKLKQWPMGL